MRPIVLNKPRLRQSFAVEVLEPRVLFLLSEHRHFVFEGEVFTALLPFLHGEHTLGEILSAMARKFSLAEVYSALHRLAGSNLLVEADGALPEHTAFWDSLSPETEALQISKRLDSRVLTVQALGGLETNAFENGLRECGLRVEPDGDLRVVLTDDYLREELAEIDRQSRVDAKPWVLVKPVGMIVWIGPLFRPPETGCWHCLEHRLRPNRQIESYIRDRSTDPIEISKTRLPSLERAGMALASAEIARLIALPSKSRLEGRIFTLDLLSYELREHIVVRRPQCKVCGQPSNLVAPNPVTLTSRIKRAGAAGERTAEPEEIFRRYQYHISPITGVVASFTARNLQACGLIHNYVTGHYFPIISNDIAGLQTNQIARSGGKGTTESQAKASALAEALERYSGIYWGDEYTVQGSFASLQPEAIDVRDVLFFSPEQYENRRQSNADPANQKHYVPEPFDNHAEISWTPLWSLTHDRVRYLPTAFCFYGHMDAGRAFSFCDSNGCAAGNTLEEAITHGFIELAERDAVAIWWYNRLRRPAVDVSSFNLPYWEKIRDYYEKELRRDLHVIDITSDLGVPTFVAISRRLDKGTEDILFGIGAHLNPRSALMQALLEANQSVPLWHFVTRAGPALKRYCPKDVYDWLQNATYENQPYLVPDDSTPRTSTEYRQLSSDDVRKDVLTCVEIARARSLEVLVLDQTRPDIGMPVVRVVVPGLRHFWRRLAPGRLYDVPVERGWLQQPLTEKDMNPISFFI